MADRASQGVVRFDTGPLGTGSLFTAPEAIIEAWRPDDVPAAFDRLESARAGGKWLAGSMAYELGYALIPTLAHRMPAASDIPLMRFGVFDAPVPPVETPPQPARLGRFTAGWDHDAYRAAFDVVHAFLRSGDIYQANLTFPLTADWDGCPYGLYDTLRHRQPVPHGALVDLGGDVLLSRSPELFFALSRDGQLRARPMKGTIRRGDGPAEDEDLKRRLANSEKDQAENLMITDLLRNDLGRLSQIGSVTVPRLFAIETYATVHQMVSEIVSRIRPGLTLIDIFAALFPCGSVTGAPKIRAMDILSQVETAPRGHYCGAIGWIAPDGSMEFNVAIRTLVLQRGGRAQLNVGGGVVYDSTPDAEFREALLKSRFAAG